MDYSVDRCSQPSGIVSTQIMSRRCGSIASCSCSARGRFAGKAVFKAQALGKHVLFVDSWGTTLFCHKCLQWVPKDLEGREHVCLNCGETIPRDLNSALLINRHPQLPAIGRRVVAR